MTASSTDGSRLVLFAHTELIFLESLNQIASENYNTSDYGLRVVIEEDACSSITDKLFSGALSFLFCCVERRGSVLYFI